MEQNKNNDESKRNPIEQSEGADQPLLSAVNQLDVAPGEWFATGIAVYSKTKRGEQYIAAMSPDSSKYDNNAMLFAASKDLYEIVKELDENYRGLCGIKSEFKQRVRAALKKAGDKSID